jgi:competence protein ComEA
VETTVPVTETAPPAPTESAQTEPAPTESGLININTATLAQLDSLPGIGPVLAQRILDYRAAHGPFTAPGQLTLVEGIGQKRLADILDLITVE